MSYDIKQNTTQVELIPPSTITTTVPQAYGTCVDLSAYTGSPLIMVQRAGGTGTGASLGFYIEAATPTKYATMDASDIYDAPLRHDTADHLTLAWKWTPTSSVAIKECWVRLKKAGTIAAAKYVQLKLMTDNSAKPSNTLIDVASTMNPLTGLTTAYDWYRFTFTTVPDLTSGTAYHFVLAGDYDVSNDNRALLSVQTAASGGTYTFYTDSWSNAVTTCKPNFKAFGYVFTAISGATETAGGGLTAYDFPVDGVGSHVRAKAKVLAGDGDTSFRVSAALVGRKQYN